MAIPYFNINSMTYSGGTVSFNADYSNFLGGASISVVGFWTGVTLSYTNSFGKNSNYIFTLSLSASTIYNLTFSFLKGPYTNYPFAQPQGVGATQNSQIISGFVPYNTGVWNPGGYQTLYQKNRVIESYTYRT
jgi:hypothetical protein